MRTSHRPRRSEAWADLSLRLPVALFLFLTHNLPKPLLRCNGQPSCAAPQTGALGCPARRRARPMTAICCKRLTNRVGGSRRPAASMCRDGCRQPWQARMCGSRFLTAATHLLRWHRNRTLCCFGTGGGWYARVSLTMSGTVAALLIKLRE